MSNGSGNQSKPSRPPSNLGVQGAMTKTERIYFYKMTTDNGGAPCSYKSMLSLAICKPKVRSAADEGDWIIGFGGKDLGERLIYVAQVSKKLKDGEYYKNTTYHNRPDCIYRWDPKEQKYGWVKGKKYHKDGLNLEHDLDNGKAVVLLSNKYTYFGEIGTADYKNKCPEIKKSIESLRQGHRINHTKDLFDELCRLIKDSIDLKINGKPSDVDSCKKCNSIEGQIHLSSPADTKCI